MWLINHNTKQNYKVYAVDRNQGDGLGALSKAGAHTSVLDVTSLESIKHFKETQIKAEPLDLLLNIAGTVPTYYFSTRTDQLGVASGSEVDSLQDSTPEIFQKTFAVNAYGPFFVTQTLLPNLEAATEPKVGIVSSRVGSIGDNSSGGHYAYRSSKAAVNSIGKSLAMDLKDKNITVLLLHPGFVQSGLLPKAKMPPETVQPEEAAEKLWRNVVHPKGIESTGTFWHREGFELPW